MNCTAIIARTVIKGHWLCAFLWVEKRTGYHCHFPVTHIIFTLVKVNLLHEH